jgi:hypothetical protein
MCNAAPSPNTAPPQSSQLPDGARLLTLEDHSRRHGSGVTAADLVGAWRFDRLWSRRGAEPQPGAAALLRSLQACLAIEASGEGQLRLCNSVRLGALQLRFEGPGELRGRRPLLVFRFERWQLLLAGRVLLQGSLAPPAQRRQPFFALIGQGRSEVAGQPATAWLAARGRGGGLALWQR